MVDVVEERFSEFATADHVRYAFADRGKTWDFTLEDLALMDDPYATHGKGGVPELSAVPEEVRRCKGLTEFNHTWVCEAVLGPGEGDMCAHCRNLEAQIRKEDAAVEEGERLDAEQALAYEQLLAAHQGDAEAVVSGVLRALVAIGQLTAEDEHGLRASASNVINQAFLHAKEMTGLSLMVFWSLVADLAAAERNSLRRAGAEMFGGCT